jgi:hypothetical protein
VLGRAHSIEDEQRGVVLPDNMAYRVNKAVKPLIEQSREHADVVHMCAHLLLLEEPEPTLVEDQALVRFGKQGDIDACLPGGSVGEGELIAKGCLPRAGFAQDKVEIASDQATIEHGIETGNPGGKAIPGDCLVIMTINGHRDSRAVGTRKHRFACAVNYGGAP